jgi:hypothetical protein
MFPSFIAGVVGIPISVIVYGYPSAFFFVVACFIFFASVSVSYLIFVPKVKHYWKEYVAEGALTRKLVPRYSSHFTSKKPDPGDSRLSQADNYGNGI